MEPRRGWIVFIFIFVSPCASSSNTTGEFQISVPDQSLPASLQLPNNTSDSIIKDQTDLIKRIISNHKVVQPEYPMVTNTEEDATEKEVREREFLEELRKKCLGLFQSPTNQKIQVPELNLNSKGSGRPILDTNHYGNTALETRGNINSVKQNINQISTVESYGPIQRPVFPQKNPQTITHPIYNPDPTKYFFGTHTNDQTEEFNQKKESISAHAHQNVKYVHLEPVILQRTILDNGEMVFYWYKNLPAIPQYVPTTVQQPSTTSQQQITYVTPSQVASGEVHQQQLVNIHNRQPEISNSYIQTVSKGETRPQTQVMQPQVVQPQVVQPQVVQPPAVPHYEIQYGKSDKIDDKVYRKQMKFVVPLSYPSNKENVEAHTRYLWQVNPYGYYSKPLQPSTINVGLPYVPNLHMIKTLSIPENVKKN